MLCSCVLVTLNVIVQDILRLHIFEWGVFKRLVTLFDRNSMFRILAALQFSHMANLLGTFQIHVQTCVLPYWYVLIINYQGSESCHFYLGRTSAKNCLIELSYCWLACKLMLFFNLWQCLLPELKNLFKFVHNSLCCGDFCCIAVGIWTECMFPGSSTLDLPWFAGWLCCSLLLLASSEQHPFFDYQHFLWNFGLSICIHLDLCNTESLVYVKRDTTATVYFKVTRTHIWL